MQATERDQLRGAGEDSARVAVVDIGSNSTRLLVADVSDGHVLEVDRRTRVTRLASGVDLSGSLSGDAIERVCAVVGDYASAYQEHGAEAVDAIATSAVRDASNGDAFIAELRERFELEARTLAGAEEALLTYRGATAEARPPEPVAVIDIGGGSTELVIGSGAGIEFHTSMQAGVVRHTERHLQADPPTATELEQLAKDIRSLVIEAFSERSGLRVESGIAVAGTPTSLAAIDLALDPYDPERVHGHELSLQSIQHQLSELASLPLAERRQVTGLHPDRAPTIVAGVVVLVETMRVLGLDAVTVSEHDILHGAAIELVRARNPH
jgi:exopolyphosphatase/guanosine-5'-triphosphate,3'-diphosphate pyrophosphatase